MGGYSVSWGVPDFGLAVRRKRVDRVLSHCTRDVRLMSAPSGWGKTIAAAHYAESSACSVLWIDAFGADFDSDELADAIVIGMSTGFRGGASGSGRIPSVDSDSLVVLLAGSDASTLVVVDDVVLTEDGLAHLSNLQRRISVAGAQFVVTSRTPFERLGSVPGVTAVGVGDLRLTSDEALELRALFGSTAPDADARTALDRCDGHIALYSLMSGSSAQGMMSGGNPRIDSWIHRLVDQGLSPLETRVLQRAALVRHGLTSELLGEEPDGALCHLDEMTVRFPLFRVIRESSGLRFIVHDSAVGVLLDQLNSEDRCIREPMLEWAIKLLEERGDHRRVLELLSYSADSDRCVAWLAGVSGDVVESVAVGDLLELIESVPLHTAMGIPRIVSLWARALYAAGDDTGAIARAKAACHLAEYAQDHDVVLASRVVWVDALSRLQRFEEAAELAIGSKLAGSREAQMAALVVRASVLMYVGRLDEALSALEQAELLVSSALQLTQESLRLVHTRALIQALGSGDWSSFVRAVATLLPHAERWRSDGMRLRGNLGMGLLETGRLVRALSAYDSLMAAAPEEISALYLVFQGGSLVGLGSVDEGIGMMLKGLELGFELGLEADAAGNRVYVSMALRAKGDPEGALTQAERAFERFCVVDYMGYRPLAALEVAASLLSLGDVAAARRWVDTVLAEGFSGNAYHALRAAMVLAECDRRDGDLDAAIGRIAQHTDHVVSESSNWQIAMYCRAFPHLLGMFAAAVGPDALPVHMLRMVLPEYAESALRACKPWLESAQWRRLGQRVLGDEDFARVERRKGGPICRVRLFGGLEVALAERTVSERDWKKRKARLLFAMLVARRGQDVPRDQVLDYLWPDLPEERARNNFYVAWSAMKSALMGSTNRSEACPYLENKGGRLRIVRDAVRSDIDEFEEALAEARKAEERDDIGAALNAYARMSAAYRGDLLPGDVYDDWFTPLRDRCRFDFVDAMVRAAGLLLESDDPNEALVYARRAQAVDPHREDLYQAVMRCSIAAGQRNAAIDMFLQLRTKLADDLGLDPSAETMALYQQILVMEDAPRYDDFGLS